MLNGNKYLHKKHKAVFFNLFLEIFSTKINNVLKKKKTLYFSIFINNLRDKITEEYELAILIKRFELEVKNLEKKITKINNSLRITSFLKIKSILLKKKPPKKEKKKKKKIIFESERVINNTTDNKYIKLNQSERIIFKKSSIKIIEKNINFDELDRFLRKKKYLKYGGRLVFLKQKSKINRKKLKTHVDKFENYLNVNY